MITRLIATNDGTDENPSWSVEDQEGSFLYDAETLEEVVEMARLFATEHPIMEVTILL